MKRIDVNQGFIKGIEPVNSHLRFVVLSPIFSGGGEWRIPLYGEIEGVYIKPGRPVTITRERKGILGRTYVQKIETSNTGHTTEIPYSQIQRINDEYKITRISEHGVKK